MERFEAAVDAVVAGDAEGLRQMLRDGPGLVRERSAREHGATLLHYCAANGVEQERQRTPPNVVDIVDALLAAGADVNATARIYGDGATTLGLAATGVHPERAGVQEALLQALLNGGATIADGDVAACLWNGRGRAAEFLAERGAALNLAEAAGLGRLELVQAFFAEGVAPKEMEDGFLLACVFGRDRVIEYLAARGVDLHAKTRDGQTGLHMAGRAGRNRAAAAEARASGNCGECVRRDTARAGSVVRGEQRRWGEVRGGDRGAGGGLRWIPLIA